MISGIIVKLFSLLSFPKSHSGPAPVLVDELDAHLFKRPANG
jgi:hypothetical protein